MEVKSPRAAELVASRLATVQFGSESEVIEAALEALTREELDLAQVDWTYVRQQVAEAEESFATGRIRRIHDVDAYFAGLRSDIAERASQQKPA